MHPLFWDPELSRMHLHPQIQIPNAFPDDMKLAPNVLYHANYSQVSIKRAGWIKQAGWNIFEK